MTKLFFRLSVFSMLLATVFMTSCEEGITIPDPGTGAVAPTVSTSSFGDEELNAGADFSTTVSASQGDAGMRDLEIFENGLKVETARLSIDGSPAAANPILLLDAAKASFSYDVTITNVPAGVNNYEFAVTDDDLEANSASVNVTGLSDPLAITLDQGNTFDGATPNTKISFPITVSGNNLSSISVAENGTLMAADALNLGDVVFDANPYFLSADDQAGFQKNLLIRVASGNNVYTITITDAAGEKVSADLTVNAGTPLSGTFTAVVLNNNSGPEKGGLDLYNGIAVSTASEFDQAQVVDQGINNDLPFADNWLQEVAPVNGARLRLAAGTQPEGFSFDSVDSQEAIVAAFDSSGEDVSNSGKLSEGDILLVNSGDDYFILQVATISVTTDNNLDFYEINIKQAIQ
ncbi:MAG: hypothetical protein AB8G22_03800 [Saprospiraceae bacterium]